MNIIKCKKCKKELNVFSGYCPNCGNKTKRNITIVIIGIAILLLLVTFIIKPILTDNKGYYSQREINKIKLNNDTIETTTKGKKFTNYFKNNFNAKYKNEFTDVILEFAKLDYINAKYIIKELEIEMKLFSEEEPKVIINEKYFEYKDTIKKEIDYLLEKYFN